MRRLRRATTEPGCADEITATDPLVVVASIWSYPLAQDSLLQLIQQEAGNAHQWYPI